MFRRSRVDTKENDLMMRTLCGNTQEKRRRIGELWFV
jgi:hypothetical protein